ncbi:uncharacterized protein tws isoform X5 [Eurosta solidaginis]|uniref:uncharacterized protein tws isoform X5 n=1 Tax=Eurosta solidaginis TaxID=178769 RepID=UPI0035311D9E
MHHISLLQSVNSMIKPTDSMIVLGDFNLPQISWNTVDHNIVPVSSKMHNNDFLDGITDLCLNQINFFPNKCGKFLDLAFVDDISKFCINRCEPLVLPEGVYHPSLEQTYEIISNDVGCTNKTRVSTRCFDFSKTNFNKLNKELSEITWPRYKEDVEENVLHFNKTIYTLFEKHVPKRTCSCIEPVQAWFTKDLKALKNKKPRLFKLYKRTGLHSHYAQYAIFRHKYFELNEKCYKAYICKIKRNIICHPKPFYDFINSKRRTNGFPSAMMFRNSISSDDQEIANFFAQFFHSNYSAVVDSSPTNYPYELHSNNSICAPHLLPEDVLLHLKTLKESFKYGPDLNPTCFLKKCAEYIYQPLTDLFNLSLKNDIFPTAWKESFLIPLHKKGSKSSIENYRGIAKLSAIPKLFEAIVTNHLTFSISTLIDSSQHGFCRAK